MTLERRKTNRLEISVAVKLRTVGVPADQVEEKIVEVVNVSRGGIAFVSDDQFELDSYFDTKITLWTKETIETVIQIVRMGVHDDGRIVYGCQFIGLMPADQLKIQIYEMVSLQNQ